MESIERRMTSIVYYLDNKSYVSTMLLFCQLVCWEGEYAVQSPQSTATWRFIELAYGMEKIVQSKGLVDNRNQ